MDAGFFRGTSVDQDGRFSDKEKKLMKTLIFEPILNTKVNLTKVNLNTIKPWISKKICEILGFEDEVVIQYIYELLETDKLPNPHKMQMQIAAFLQAYNARIFMKDLWGLLVSAQNNSAGIPDVFIKQKKDELLILKSQKVDREISLEDIEAISLKVAKMVPHITTNKITDSPPTPNHGIRKSKPIPDADNLYSSDDNFNYVNQNKVSTTTNMSYQEECISKDLQNNEIVVGKVDNSSERSDSSSNSTHRNINEDGRYRRSHNKSSIRVSRSISRNSSNDSRNYRNIKPSSGDNSSSSDQSSNRRSRHRSRTLGDSDDSNETNHSKNQRSHVSYKRSRRNVSKDRRRHSSRRYNTHHRRRHHNRSTSSNSDNYKRHRKSYEKSHHGFRRDDLVSTRKHIDYTHHRRTRKHSPEKWIRRDLSSSPYDNSSALRKNYYRKESRIIGSRYSRRRESSSPLNSPGSIPYKNIPNSDITSLTDNSIINKHPTISPPKPSFSNDGLNNVVSLDSEVILRQKAIESMMKKARSKRFHKDNIEKTPPDNSKVAEYPNNAET